MSRSNEPKTKATEPTNTNDILRKMQYQLDCMERKIDSLVKQSAPQDFKNQYPSSPRREFDNKKRPFKVKHAKRKAGVKNAKGFYSDISSGEKKTSSKSHFRNKKKNLKAGEGASSS